MPTIVGLFVQGIHASLGYSCGLRSSSAGLRTNSDTKSEQLKSSICIILEAYNVPHGSHPHSNATFIQVVQRLIDSAIAVPASAPPDTQLPITDVISIKLHLYAPQASY